MFERILFVIVRESGKTDWASSKDVNEAKSIAARLTLEYNAEFNVYIEKTTVTKTRLKTND